MYLVKWSTQERDIARCIHDKLDSSLQYLVCPIMNAAKWSASSTRRGPTPGLTHPASSSSRIPNVLLRVKEFLKDFGDGAPDLEPMEIAAFNYIKSTANSTDSDSIAEVSN